MTALNDLSRGEQGLNRPPFATLDISLSNRCPLRCAHCMFAADLKYEGPTIGPDRAKELIDDAAKLRTFNMIATGSQEFYLDYDNFLSIVRYAHARYRIPLTITTSCYWCTSEELAASVFTELQTNGLIAALISLDRYHLQFLKLYRVKNALAALKKLGIHSTVQTIRGKNHETSEYFKAQLGELAQGDWIDFVQHNVTPIGRGADIPDAELELEEGIPSGDCNIFEVCHIEPDGAVKPCCGGGLTASGLTCGNVNQESLIDIAARANIDPLFNSLRTHEGPSHLFSVLRDNGFSFFEGKKYTGTCHACADIFSRDEVVSFLRSHLRRQAVELLVARWYAYDRNVRRIYDRGTYEREEKCTE